jgi:hypothetical protein
MVETGHDGDEPRESLRERAVRSPASRAPREHAPLRYATSTSAACCATLHLPGTQSIRRDRD